MIYIYISLYITNIKKETQVSSLLNQSYIHSYQKNNLSNITMAKQKKHDEHLVTMSKSLSGLQLISTSRVNPLNPLWFFTAHYPLANSLLAIEHGPFLMGKSTINGALFVYQRLNVGGEKPQWMKINSTDPASSKLQGSLRREERHNAQRKPEE